MLRSPKLATPPTAATGVVPLSVAPPGLLPSATVMAPLNPVATLPRASSARTFTAGVICWPATVVLGCVPNTSWLAAPAVILNELLVALTPLAAAMRQPPALFLRSTTLNDLTTHFTDTTVVLPR